MRGQQYTEEPTCIGCKKKATQLNEIVLTAKYSYGTDAITFIKCHEGTYDMFKPNMFYCDSCYIHAGMPVHNGRRRF